MATPFSQWIRFLLARGEASFGTLIVLNGHEAERLPQARDSVKDTKFRCTFDVFDAADAGRVAKFTDRSETRIGPIKVSQTAPADSAALHLIVT